MLGQLRSGAHSQFCCMHHSFTTNRVLGALKSHDCFPIQMLIKKHIFGIDSNILEPPLVALPALWESDQSGAAQISRPHHMIGDQWLGFSSPGRCLEQKDDQMGRTTCPAWFEVFSALMFHCRRPSHWLCVDQPIAGRCTYQICFWH